MRCLKVTFETHNGSKTINLITHAFPEVGESIITEASFDLQEYVTEYAKRNGLEIG